MPFRLGCAIGKSGHKIFGIYDCNQLSLDLLVSHLLRIIQAVECDVPGDDVFLICRSRLLFVKSGKRTRIDFNFCLLLKPSINMCKIQLYKLKVLTAEG